MTQMAPWLEALPQEATLDHATLEAKPCSPGAQVILRRGTQELFPAKRCAAAQVVWEKLHLPSVMSTKTKVTNLIMSNKTQVEAIELQYRNEVTTCLVAFELTTFHCQ